MHLTEHEIYEVHAVVVDANGSMSELSGYPKKFDSVKYDHNLEKTVRRALGEAQEAGSKMAKADTRQVQHAYVIRMSDGEMYYRISYGKLKLVEAPDPEPEPIPVA